ncbi:Protein ImuB [Phycisphaerales bacterium]|nr:Protein ImuB [Phycisphaerales bacterium]
MKRAMSVWFPFLSIDLLRRRDRRSRPGSPPEVDRRPILLVATWKQRQIVAACCERAINGGVRPGLVLADAQGVLRGARVESHRPDRDAAALQALALWATRYSPRVSVDPPDGLLIDATGCERAFGGEPHLHAKVIEGCGDLALRARASIAPTFAGAWAMARHADAPIVAPHDLRASLAPLPLAALRVEQDVRDALAEVGVERIEHLMALPRSMLPARFGHELPLRLSQALGEAIEAITPVRWTEPLRVSRAFEGPTTQYEGIDLTIRDLLADLVALLRTHESGARGLQVILTRADLPAERLDIALSRPSRDARHVYSLLRPRLDRVNLGFGVLDIEITATRLARLRHRQREQWEGGDSTEELREQALGELLDTLSNRIGVEHVRRAAVVESHLPERAGTTAPTSMDAGASTDIAVVPQDRPTILFGTPLFASVTTLSPDGPLLSVRFRQEDLHVAYCLGPERLSPEWWRRDEPARDYFKIQDQHGRWWWIARRVEIGDWFIHGVWG